MFDVTAFWMILGFSYCLIAIFVGFVRYFRERKDFGLVFFPSLITNLEDDGSIVSVVN